MDYFLFDFSGVQFHYTMSHPFYSEENMSHLKRLIDDVKSGKAKLTEHELIED